MKIKLVSFPLSKPFPQPLSSLNDRSGEHPLCCDVLSDYGRYKRPLDEKALPKTDAEGMETTLEDLSVGVIHSILFYL